MAKLIFDKKNIIVTGGAGFIGSHLIETLIKSNKVICIDNLSTGNERNIDHLLQLPDFHFINHDINKPLDLEDIPELEKFKIPFQGIQEIYHLACPASPVAIDSDPIGTSLASSVGVKNILDLTIKYKAKFLFTSSSYIYGLTSDEQEFVPESYIGPYDHLAPRSAYVEGKKYAESLINDYKTIHNLDAKIARIFNVYGPRIKINDGRIVPDLIMKALDNQPMVIPGNENLRNSFCYVTDLVEALIKYMETAETGPMNIGNPESMSLVSVAQKIKNLTDSTSEIVFADFDKYAIKSIVPDISLAKEKLGWFPITLIDQGLDIIIKDLQASKHVLNYYNDR